ACSQVRGGERFEHAEKLARRRPNGRNNDRLAHVGWLTEDQVRDRTLIRATVSSPKSIRKRSKIIGVDRSISRHHAGVAASTRRRRPSRWTDVTRSRAGPTAAFQANVTLP